MPVDAQADSNNTTNQGNNRFSLARIVPGQPLTFKTGFMRRIVAHMLLPWCAVTDLFAWFKIDINNFAAAGPIQTPGPHFLLTSIQR